MNCPCPASVYEQGPLGPCVCLQKASRAGQHIHPIRRAVAPFHTEDGGAHFNGGISFPILPDEEAADLPLATPSEASAWAVFAQIAFVALTVSCSVVALIQFFTAH